MNTTRSPAASGRDQSANSSFTATRSIARGRPKSCRAASSSYSSAAVAAPVCDLFARRAGALAQHGEVLHFDLDHGADPAWRRPRARSAAAASSSGVLTLSRAVASGSSSSGTPVPRMNLRGQLRAGVDRSEDRRARGGFVDRAQRLGQAVVCAAIGSNDLRTAPAPAGAAAWPRSGTAGRRPPPARPRPGARPAPRRCRRSGRRRRHRPRSAAASART